MSFNRESGFLDHLDRLSYLETPIHRLDSRAKVMAAFLFLFTIISYPKYEVISLTPFFLFPVLLAALGDIPVGFLLRSLLYVSPFAVFIGIFNPLFDSRIVGEIGGFSISGGWWSLASILVKFSLTVSMSLLLIATTSFPGVCQALRRLGFPKLFVAQLLFLYRYLFVLAEETRRMIRARDLRSFDGRGQEWRVSARLIGVLLLRTLSRAERIHGAMLSRGYSGDLPSEKSPAFSPLDALFLMSVTGFLCLFRFFPVTERVGRFFQGILG